MHAGQRTIELSKSTPRRRGETFEALAVALGISNSSLRRWARCKKQDGSSRVIGAHFIRGRWVLLGKLTPKRVEFIRQGLNLHKGLSEKPKKKWEWKSKEERIAIFDQQIQKLEKDFDDLPGTEINQKYKRLIEGRWRAVKNKKFRLIHAENYPGHYLMDFRHWLKLEDELDQLPEEECPTN